MEFIVKEHEIYIEDENKKRIAEVTFPEIEDKLYNINHTFVDDSLRGQGIAKQLVEKAIKTINSKGGKVCATCPYAVSYFNENECEIFEQI